MPMPALAPARILPRAAAALLCLAVSWIHVQDQGGFPGDKTPHYVANGYYLLEATGILCAVLLLVGSRLRVNHIEWLLAAGVALGPCSASSSPAAPGCPITATTRATGRSPSP
ncbi:hypothetical protein [Kitasatospora mediocidica]|uniref:hypothetical protein n=1 Tax=Kitasatospora mediocidica TaxID=58352 RepID=UPI000AE0652F|nr:hypothetical protein [Kitasatospora mediocidica]